MSTNLIPDWLKNEDEIYSRLKGQKVFGPVNTGIDSIRDHWNLHIQSKNLNWSNGPYYSAPYNWYPNIPPGIEKDNLKHITVAIINWERHFYIPYVMEMYNNQDYPKNLIEILIVDDDSINKLEVLNIVKEQVKLYPDLKIRFIQNYVNKCQGPPKRTNMAVRFATHNIVIINETDNIPLGKNYLRGVCYAHNRFKEITCMGIPINFSGNILNDVFKEDPSGYAIMNRFGAGVFSFDKELFSGIRGFDEKHVGWGGHETSIFGRYTQAGGKYFMNLDIFCGGLPNFPTTLPPGAIPAGGGIDDWQHGIVINDDNWGISEKMEEIDLYK